MAARFSTYKIEQNPAAGSLTCLNMDPRSEKRRSDGRLQDHTQANRRPHRSIQIVIITILIGLSILSLSLPWSNYLTLNSLPRREGPPQAPGRHDPLPVRQLRFGSFNIRYDGTGGRDPPPPPAPPSTLNFLTQSIKRSNFTQSHSAGYGERPWRERRTKIADSVIWSELDVVGFQEVLVNQLRDLEGLLGGYEGVGVGRDDGIEKGEAVPIFWRRDRFSLLDVQHFWLSDTPDIPGSVSWDIGIAQPRMVTLIHLSDRSSSTINKDNDFLVLNTHWDDKGLNARRESAKLILKKVEELVERKYGDGKLVVLLGDLNSPASEEGYQILTGSRYKSDKFAPPATPSPGVLSDSKSFLDSRHEVLLSPSSSNFTTPLLNSPFGCTSTFTGFERSDRAQIIDFVLVLDNGVIRQEHNASESRATRNGWDVVRYGVLPNQFDDDTGGMLISDHRLVVAALEGGS